ncbi:MAG: DNA repair protein RadA [Acidobacteriota bacterium]
MGKSRTLYVCQECGYGSPKWMGKCPGCNAWNTLVEEVIKEANSSVSAIRTQSAVTLAEIEGEDGHRFSSGIGELDRVLGGGIVPGSMVLLGGDPGIGKSTILLQVAENLSCKGIKVLYLSGEESARQIKMRASRLGMKGTSTYILNEPDISLLSEYINEIDPQLVIIDSIQTVSVPEVGSVPGSVSQLRESTARLMELAKKSDRAFFLVGHVTKEGALAGPKVLEHMVDTVIYFEGDKNNYFRILRAVKNRYGSVNEIGIMEMSGTGLIEVDNASRVLMGDRGDMPGSTIVASFEGTRAILVEVEALVVGAGLGYPRRMATGIDANRLALIAAVLEKKGGLQLGNKDIYLKVAGGTILKDPATDLGVAAAIVSSFYERRVPAGSVIIGELGLSGEIRPVPYLDIRLKEAEKMGLTAALIPKEKGKRSSDKSKLQIVQAETLDSMLRYI